MSSSQRRHRFAVSRPSMRTILIGCALLAITINLLVINRVSDRTKTDSVSDPSSPTADRQTFEGSPTPHKDDNDSEDLAKMSNSTSAGPEGLIDTAEDEAKEEEEEEIPEPFQDPDDTTIFEDSDETAIDRNKIDFVHDEDPIDNPDEVVLGAEEPIDEEDLIVDAELGQEILPDDIINPHVSKPDIDANADPVVDPESEMDLDDPIVEPSTSDHHPHSPRLKPQSTPNGNPQDNSILWMGGSDFEDAQHLGMKMTKFETTDPRNPFVCSVPPSEESVLQTQDKSSLSRPLIFLLREEDRSAPDKPTIADNDQLRDYCEHRYQPYLVKAWQTRRTDMCMDSCEGLSTQGTQQFVPNEDDPEPLTDDGSNGWLLSADRPPVRSEIECHMSLLDHSPTVPMNLCRTRNIAIDLEAVKRIMLPDPKKLANVDEGWPEQGTMKAQCVLRPEFSEMARWGNGAQKWLYDALREDNNTIVNVTPNITCSGWIDHPLFMIMRWDVNNVYHIHEDLLQTYLGYSVFDLDANESEIVFLDGDPEWGNKRANAIWKSVYSGSGKKQTENSLETIRTIRDLVNDQELAGGDGGYLCLRSAAFGVHAGLSTLSRQVGVQTQCTDSPVLRAFSDFVLTRMGLPPAFTIPPGSPVADPPSVFSIPRYALSSELQDANITSLLQTFSFTNWSAPPLIVTFSSRVGNVFGPVERQITNEKELLDAMRTAIIDKFQQERVERPLIFRRIDFAQVHKIREQMALVRESDVFVGAHGAAFIYTLYLPSWGGVVELQHPSRYYNYHFENIARLTGREYGLSFIIDPVINVDDVAKLTVDIVGKVLVKKEKAERA